MKLDSNASHSGSLRRYDLADPLRVARREVEAAGIQKPALLAATRADEANGPDVALLRAAFPDLDVVTVSILDDASLDALRAGVWGLTGLIRVYLRSNGVVGDEPLPVPSGATIVEVAGSVHSDPAASLTGARVWGPCARFNGQRVGGAHRVADGDIVEILTLNPMRGGVSRRSAGGEAVQALLHNASGRPECGPPRGIEGPAACGTAVGCSSCRV